MSVSAIANPLNSNAKTLADNKIAFIVFFMSLSQNVNGGYFGACGDLMQVML
jgi:hypothetical protein